MTELKKLNQADERYRKLLDEGKVEFLNSPKEMKAMEHLSRLLILSKKQYVISNAKSIKSSKEAILTH